MGMKAENYIINIDGVLDEKGKIKDFDIKNINFNPTEEEIKVAQAKAAQAAQEAGIDAEVVNVKADFGTKFLVVLMAFLLKAMKKIDSWEKKTEAELEESKRKKQEKKRRKN